ncbi:sodium/proline symporter PutP [Nigerium massiliense]|uniref:sodium/proline symporter PutP n=1 Tax=Nigerium massiliense TaxID=1522317 RepID=UPI00058AF467|nr:sodium/proline symporter PutP [Nigerium massiliense]
MTASPWTIAAIVLYFAAMIAIGLFAFRRTEDHDDYMLGGRSLSPFVAALSAGAADMSGWLLMGLPGALYVAGLVESWIAIGLTVGAWLNWKFVAPRLRVYTQAVGAITVPTFFENRTHDRSRLLRIVSGLVILVFFTFYVSSGMVAGGVFFQSSFGTTYQAGMLIVAGVTLLYTLFGGFLGATYTDVVQGCIMVISLLMVPAFAIAAVGGFGPMVDSVTQVNAEFASLTQGATVIGVVSSLAWGLGYFGQPHIIVRFMALRNAEEAKQGRWIGIGWMILSVGGAILTAMAGIAYFHQHPEQKLTDPEAVFLDLSQILFHPFFAGIVLSAVLAAIMSTMSSQMVVTSSALIEDLLRIISHREYSKSGQLWLGRVGVLIIAVVATVLAWARNETILDLVGFAWAGFGGAFGPIVLLSLWWPKLTNWGAITGMVAGAVTVFVWGRFEPDVALGWLPEHLYEIVPGFLICLVLAVVVSLLTNKHDPAIEREFNESTRRLRRFEETTADQAA